MRAGCAELSSQRFYDDCCTMLADSGIMVANLWAGYPDHEECLARIHNSFADRVVIIEAEDSPNRIVLAVKNAKLFPLAIDDTAPCEIALRGATR